MIEKGLSNAGIKANAKNEELAIKIDGFLKSLKSITQEFELLNLEIAFKPTENFLKKLHKWVQKNTTKNVILNLKITPEILGGVKISFKGKYKDYSVQKKFENFNWSQVADDITAAHAK